MRVLFIYPDILPGKHFSGYYYMGVGYLAAVLKRAGHVPSLLHITKPIEKADLIRAVKEYRPDLIAFSSTTNMFPYVKIWAKVITENYDVPTICGGIHPTLSPVDSISTEGLDMICRGEGEGALVELCDAIESGKEVERIGNLWIKKNGGIVQNPMRPLIRDLDSLPFPDREVFDFANLELSKEGRGLFFASRGCPYDCSYCCNRALQESYQDSPVKVPYVRFRSVGNVISEIQTVLKKYPFIKTLHFDDDILPLNKKWFAEFAEKYGNEVHLPFSCNIRPNLVNEGLVELLKRAGCYQAQLGVESGNKYLRNQILNRGVSDEQIINAFSLCRRAGIQTYSYSMIGLPFEDMRGIFETIKMNGKVMPDLMQVTIFYPYLKTKLYNVCQEKGFLTERVLTYYTDESILRLPTLSETNLTFTKYFFRRLARVYSKLAVLPPPVAKAIGRTLEKVLSREWIQFSLLQLYYSLRFVNRLVSPHP